MRVLARVKEVHLATQSAPVQQLLVSRLSICSSSKNYRRSDPFSRMAQDWAVPIYCIMTVHQFQSSIIKWMRGVNISQLHLVCHLPLSWKNEATTVIRHKGKSDPPISYKAKHPTGQTHHDLLKYEGHDGILRGRSRTSLVRRYAPMPHGARADTDWHLHQARTSTGVRGHRTESSGPRPNTCRAIGW